MRRRTTTAVATVLAAAWLLGGSVCRLAAQAPAGVTGQPVSAGQPTQDGQDQFVPVKALPQQDQLPAATLVMVAYGFVWAVLLVYVWTVWRRLVRVEREMRDLSQRIAEKGVRR
jgi:CcmD family protein